MHHLMRRTLFALLAASASTQLAPAAAFAIDGVSCRAGEEPHAGRQFTLTSRTEPLIGNYSYRWDLDGDGTFETDTGTESSIRTEKTTPGTYTFGVVATDNDVPAGDPKREARGTCQVTVVNDPPKAYFEAHPVDLPLAAAYEAIRFTYSGYDSEDAVEQRAMTHSFDFDADGRFEHTALGGGEVFASFPAGFDKDVTHRLTDTGGASVDTKIHVKVTHDAFGFGGNSVIAPVATGTLGKVTGAAPKSIKRKTLLKRGLVITFQWGPTWGRAEVVPVVRHKGKTATGYGYDPEGGYAPGQRLTVNRLPSQLTAPIRRGAKKLQLRWKAHGQEGPAQEGTLVIRITR